MAGGVENLSGPEYGCTFTLSIAERGHGSNKKGTVKQVTAVQFRPVNEGKPGIVDRLKAKLLPSR